MTPFNVGIVGLGGMGTMMLTDMRKHNLFNVVLIWDPSEAAGQRLQTQYSDLRIATDAGTLIRDKSINLLYVASPPNTHREYFLQAIEAEVAILCEKPFAVDIAESEDLLKRITVAGLRNVINFNHNNALGSTHLEQQLQTGAMGTITGADVFIHLNQWPRDFQKNAHWLGQREQGGFTREMISHWLYLTRRLLGEGTVTRSFVVFPDDGVSAETHLTAELDFGGIPLFIRVATGGVGPVGTQYTVWGTQKSFRLHSGGRISASDGGDWQEEFTEIEDIGTDDRQRTLDGVAARVQGESINMADAADGFAVQKLIETLLKGKRS